LYRKQEKRTMERLVRHEEVAAKELEVEGMTKQGVSVTHVEGTIRQS
jgi:hypothetical protein